MTTGTAQVVRDSKGTVRLGALLGKGGEGSVYDITGTPDRVAKVYHQPIDTQKEAKLQAMVGLGNDRLLMFAAWPLDVLRSPRGEPVGFIMPKAGGFKDIHSLYGPRSRKTEFPNADWRFLIRAAANTARAFAAVHEAGHVIGDVNHGGVAISGQATARLIDCDSFQVTAAGRRFTCDVGVPTFTAPELQGKAFRGLARTANHDNFGLALLMFHLLCMGRHPFAGRFLGRGDMPLEQAIAEFRFAYGTGRMQAQMEPPPNVPAISVLSQPVVLMLERAFSRDGARDGVRPGAREWVTALDALEKRLKACGTNASHHHLDGLDRCPWCHIEAATGVLLFNFRVQPEQHVGSGGTPAELWARIAAVVSPGAAPPPLPHAAFPSDAAVAVRRGVRGNRIAGAMMLFIGVGALIAVAPKLVMLWLVGLVVGLFIVIRMKPPTEEVRRYQAAVRAAEDRWRTIKGRWDQEAGDQRFAEQLRQLEVAQGQLLELPGRRQRRMDELQRGRERQQRRAYLERFAIDRAEIKGIGPGRRTMLESYGVETAWDVTETAVMRVPGFGPALTNSLLRWRRTHESRFRFDPAKGIDPKDVADLEREIGDVRRRLEQQLVAGPNALSQIRTHVLAQRSTLRPLVEEAARALAQAEADLAAVS